MNEKKILVIDDEPFMVRPVLDRIEAIYGTESYMYAQYIGQGIKYLNENNISCIYLDLIMPWDNALGKQNLKITGINILKIIRSSHPDLPILCYTVVNDDAFLTMIEKEKAEYIDKTTRNSFKRLFDFFEQNHASR